MKKKKMSFSIKEMLSKDQMKKVKGGSGSGAVCGIVGVNGEGNRMGTCFWNGSSTVCVDSMGNIIAGATCN